MNVNNFNTNEQQSDLADYILEHMVQIPWQDERTALPDDENQLYCCLGISPSQFRRMMSTQKGLPNSNELAVLYARAALQYALERMNLADNDCQPSLMVLIVDAIQQYNFAVFNNKLIKTGVALKYALDEGSRLFEIFSQAHSQLPTELSRRVILLRWQDIHDSEYEKCVTAVRTHLCLSETFHTLVDTAVQYYIDARKSQGNLSVAKRDLLREYIIYELPALVRGINYDGHKYPIIIHPTLNYSTRSNYNQRNAIVHLLEYVRNSPVLCAEMGINRPSDVCNIYDIDMPADLSLANAG